MARITKYTIDGTITDSDKLLGTDAESANATKNYLVGDLADYITSDWVAVGSGTTNYIPLWTPDGNTIGDSIMFQVDVGASSPIVQVGDYSASGGTTETVLGTGYMTTTGLFAEQGSFTNITSGATGVVTIQGNAIIGDAATDILQISSSVTDYAGTASTAAGQVLVSTANGQLVWAPAPSSGTVTGTGVNNYFPIWTDGPNGGIGDSQLRQSSQFSNGLYQIRMENTDRFVINRPASVTSGDPAFQIAQDGTAKVEFGWDDDGGGYGFLYNYAGLGWRFGAAGGNNPELEITTTAGSEGVTITNKLYINGNTTTAGDLIVENGLVDGDSTYGTAGQVLSTTGTGQNVEWIDAPGLSGTGITNFVPKWSAADALQDSIIFDDGTNVGIGVSGTNPADKLHVQGTIRAVVPTASGTAFNAINSSGGASSGIRFDNNNSGLILKNSAEVVTAKISSSGFSFFNGGNVGIGTNSPTATLDVAGGVNISGPVGIGTTTPNAASILHLVDTNPQLRIQEAGNTAFSRIFTGANNALRFGVGTNGDTRMTILSSNGNVGIGTTTPGATLDVNGNFKLSTYGSGNYPGTAAYTLAVDSSGNVIETANAGGGTAIVPGQRQGYIISVTNKTVGSPDFDTTSLCTNVAYNRQASGSLNWSEYGKQWTPSLDSGYDSGASFGSRPDAAFSMLEESVKDVLATTGSSATANWRFSIMSYDNWMLASHEMPLSVRIDNNGASPGNGTALIKLVEEVNPKTGPPNLPSTVCVWFVDTTDTSSNMGGPIPTIVFAGKDTAYAKLVNGGNQYDAGATYTFTGNTGDTTRKYALLIEDEYYSNMRSKYLKVTGGRVVLQNLPTSDPLSSGIVWNDSGTLKISAG